MSRLCGSRVKPRIRVVQIFPRLSSFGTGDLQQLALALMLMIRGTMMAQWSQWLLHKDFCHKFPYTSSCFLNTFLNMFYLERIRNIGR